MKNMGTGVRVVVVTGLLLPNFALAAKPKAVAKDCESKVSASYQKKAVEVGMASIVGSISELEAVSEREGLERRLEAEKAGCLHVAHASSVPAPGTF